MIKKDTGRESKDKVLKMVESNPIFAKTKEVIRSEEARMSRARMHSMSSKTSVPDFEGETESMDEI
jgi:hypothetical protein